MNINLDKDWKKILQPYFEKSEFVNFYNKILQEYALHTVYPEKENIWRAFQLSFFDIKVVILGQDPYHGLGQAEGLAFSVPEGSKLPPSLKNIYKEIELEFGVKKDFQNGNLKLWVDQGVFLLNSVLTVRENTPASHQGLGWEKFTDYVIESLSDQRSNLVFILWGNYAKQKKSLIDSNKHLILDSAHPSPFSANRGFFGNNHFIKANQYLESNNLEIINW